MLACHHLSQKSPQAITRLVFHREAHLGQFLLHLVVHIHVPLLRLDGDEVVAFPEVAAHLVRGMGVNGGLVLGHDALDQIVVAWARVRRALATASPTSAENWRPRPL